MARQRYNNAKLSPRPKSLKIFPILSLVLVSRGSKDRCMGVWWWPMRLYSQLQELEWSMSILVDTVDVDFNCPPPGQSHSEVNVF